MKNEELIERNILVLNELLSNDFLKEEYFECPDNNHKAKIINLIKTQKSYLEKYKIDYRRYFINSRITENVKDGWYVWVVLGTIVLLAYLLSPILLEVPFITLNDILIILGLGFVAPTIICSLVPIIKGLNIYKNYLNNLNTKLEIIKNDQLEKGLTEEKPKAQDKKINDSFVKIMKDTIMKIKSLEYSDKNKDLLKIKEISEEYFAILKKEISLDSTTVNLTTNEDIIALQNKLMEIENDAIAKAKIESDENALASELGPLTTLDRSSVELNPFLDGPTLGRKLKN